MRGWRPALRIARRELLRAKGRTALVLFMVLLPVTAVVCLSTLLRTDDISPVESLPRELGSASARLEHTGSAMEQHPDSRASSGFDNVPVPTPAQLRAALPADSGLLEVRTAHADERIEVGDRRRRVALVAVDLRKPELTGPFRVLSGRAPAGADEVAVSQELADLGIEVGSSIELPAGRRTVTGVVNQPDSLYRSRAVLGSDDAVGLVQRTGGQGRFSVHYWVTGPPVEWADVRRLNGLGFLVLSRAVVLDPPPADQVPQSVRDSSEAAVVAAILALIATMAVLEVTLLAGPAFAVGARRQRRSLALLAATGGEPAHVRKVVLSQGLLVGVVAAAVGVPLGIGIAAAVRAVLTRYEWRPGPFEVSVRDVLLVALLGAGVALLAALAPAWVMARQPIVAALQGRRVTSAGAGRPAFVGLLLMGVGLVITIASLRFGRFTVGGNSELGVAAGAIPTVLGAVLLAPAALALAGRAASRLPLALRFATRDADRQRGRTAPAVAAIAATVAGVIALGIAASSDAAENRQTYRPDGPAGVAVITDYSEQTDWDAVAATATAALPEEPVTVVRGLPASGAWEPDAVSYQEVQVCRKGERPSFGRCSELQQESYSSFLGSEVLVGTQALDALAPSLDRALVSQARDVLRSGGVLVGTASREAVPEVTLRLTVTPIGSDGSDRPEVRATVDAAALRLPTGNSLVGVRAIVPEELADELGGARTVAVAVGDRLTRSQEAALRSSVERLDDGLMINVERGYEDRGDRTVLLILAVVAGLVVLGGTLAATSLALSEARPDLSTLGQVGARPRTRRAVAGGYAYVLGLVGAALGVLAGLIPGVAAAVALTRNGSYSSGWLVGGGVPAHLVEQPRFYLDIPWWLLLLVLVALPLASAGVAAAATRSRLDGPTRALA